MPERLLELAANVRDDAEVLRRHRRELGLAGATRALARLEIEPLGFVEPAHLVVEQTLNVHRVADRCFVAQRFGDGERGLEAVERRVQVQLDAVRDADPAEEGRGDRRLVWRAQLRERLLVERACFLRPTLPLRQLRTIDERRRRRRRAEQPRLQRMLERVRQRLRGVAHAISGCVDGTVVEATEATVSSDGVGHAECGARPRRGAAAHSTYDAPKAGKVIGPAGEIPVWPDGSLLVHGQFIRPR